MRQDNESMNAIESTMLPTPEDPDTLAVLEHLVSGRPIDPEAYRRIRKQGDLLTEEIRRVHGVVSVAVDLIRETRDER
jgi:hypothetical protein